MTPERIREIACGAVKKMLGDAQVDDDIEVTTEAIRSALREQREELARVCEEKQTYSMPIPCPDGISGCCVAHYVPARREKTGTECAAAIRAKAGEL